MKCEALITHFLMDYCEGRLPLGRRLDFEIHLGLCYACRRYVASYRQTMVLGKKVAREIEQEPPAEMVATILRLCGEKAN